MKLLQIYIGNYHVLRDLRISFGPSQTEDTAEINNLSYALDFLVGINGSGKSTVLRVLAELFQALERDAPIFFPFELEYEIRQGGQRQRVWLSNRSSDETPGGFQVVSPPRISVNGEERSQFSQDLLPARIVAFTTGSEAEWESIDELTHFVESESAAIRNMGPRELAIRELPGRPGAFQTPDAERQGRFLFIRAQHLPLITLCGLLANMAENERPTERRLSKVLQEAKIGFFRGFSLKLRINQGIATAADKERVLLLSRYATRKLRLGADYLLIFDFTDREHSLSKQILAAFSGGLRLFEILARLAAPTDGGLPILRQVNLFLERSAWGLDNKRQSRSSSDGVNGNSPIHLLEWLSDGELSFLGRMCLFVLLGETEALILLDEPEIHFNDYWKREIVHLMDEVLGGYSSHLLVTSHSSITLTDVPREDVVILNRTADYTGNSFHPWVQTYAADPSDVMVHVFGTPQATGAQSIARIENAMRSSPDRDPADRRRELLQLLKQVSPGYWSYRIRRRLAQLERELQQR